MMTFSSMRKKMSCFFSMTFRVTDPKTDIKPVYGSGEQENDIVDLTE